MAVVWPWSGKQEHIENMDPDMYVWTIRANEPDPTSIYTSIDGLLCDCAWTKRKEIYSHHWFEKGKPQPHILSMTLLEYLKLNLAEVEGMNPFWTIGRHEFLDAWTGHHGHHGEIATALASRL